ncbi:acyl-CoA N-acyltransferase [Umbelopsis sp. PMI_123]|nr:acyl-CoA N-acyltransferase [Umbelopsis sp. PMI_123]
MAPHIEENDSELSQTSTLPIQKQKTGIINIRNATVDDAEAIAAIGSGVFSHTFGYSLSDKDLQTYLKDSYAVPVIVDELKDPLKHFIVACDEHDKVLGFSQLTKGSSEPCVANAQNPIELQRIYVHHESHGLGIGKLLIQKSESIAISQGFKTIWLGVWEDNFRAQKVYKKSGYVQVGEHDFKMGDCIQTDYIMIKTL